MLSCHRNPDQGSVFCRLAVTFTVESDTTVSSRFHCANPGIDKTTTCEPVPRPISDGVLPTYRPSTMISAPEGVELKLHFTFSGSSGGGEFGSGAAADSWGFAAAPDWGAGTDATNR